MKTEIKATCKRQNESSCNACWKTEPVTSEGDAGEVDWDPVNGNDEFAKDEIDQDKIEWRSKLKIKSKDFFVKIGKRNGFLDVKLWFGKVFPGWVSCLSGFVNKLRLGRYFVAIVLCLPLNPLYDYFLK